MSKFIPLVLINLIGCGQGKSDDIANIPATTFPAKSFYPNQKTIAFEMVGNDVFIYSPQGFKSIFNTKSKQFSIPNAPENVIYFPYQKIHRFLYFAPTQFSENHKYAPTPESDASGEFKQSFQYNSLGEITNFKSENPEKNEETLYSYNKFGQILKINDKGLFKTNYFENKYNQFANLITQKINSENLKSTREFRYDAKNRIATEKISEKEIAPNGRTISDEKYIFTYVYNSENQLIEKKDEKSEKIVRYQYNSQNLLVKELVYNKTFDNGDDKYNFQETSFEYDDEKRLTKETIYHFYFSERSKLVNHQWIAMSPKEQNDLAWQKYIARQLLWNKDEVTSFTYTPNSIEVVKKEFSNYIRLVNNESIKEHELRDQTSTKHQLDADGKIIKKEIVYNNKTDAKQEVTYSY